MMRTVKAIRYVTPLREGGSLPAIIEADDQQLYVLKFRGAGQGVKALIAELIVGEVARTLGLPVPEIVFVEVDAVLAQGERDPEIQDLIRASFGLNLALSYLPQALAFNPLLPPPSAELASRIVWCDAFFTNIDRTPRNPNLLIWNRQLWLIDHGAALYIQHTWINYQARARSRFPQIREHILLPFASMLATVDPDYTAQLTPALLRTILAYIPDIWLADLQDFASPDEHRAAYLSYLTSRLEAPRDFVEEALHAHTQSV